MNRKIIVILTGIFIFFVAAVIFIDSLTRHKFNTQPTNNMQQTHSFSQILPKNSALQNEKVSVPPSSSIEQTNRMFGWKTYNDQGYNLQYPPDWITKTSQQENYITLTLAPNISGYYDPIAPHITISKITNSQISLQAREETMVFGTSSIKKLRIGNEIADVLLLTTEGPVIGGQSYGKVTTEYAFLQKESDQYYIIVSYSADSSRANDLTIVNNILNSLHF